METPRRKKREKKNPLGRSRRLDKKIVLDRVLDEPILRLIAEEQK